MRTVDRYWCWGVLACISIVCYMCKVDCEVGPWCRVIDRLGYSFCHVNMWHLLANIWASFLISRSGYRDTPDKWAWAVLIAFSVPSACGPAMGMSGVIYAMLGMLSWQAIEPKKFHLWVLAFIFIGLLFPTRIGVVLHMYCYSVGILVEAVLLWIEDEIKGKI